MRGTRELRRALRWVRARFSRGGLVLLYHRVAESDIDPWDLCVSPARFREQMAALRQWADPMPLTDFAGAAQRRELPRRAVSVTFDDGYVDNLHHALPALTEYSIPATLFVTTGNHGRAFWWDRLAHAVLGGEPRSPHVEIRVGDQTRNWSLEDASPERRRQVMVEIHAYCSRLPLEDRETVMRQLEKWSGRTVPDTDRAMTPEEVAAVADSPDVTIGAHTVTHPPLAALSPEAQQFELEQSRRELERLVDRPVTTMSYPFGMPNEHYTAATVNLARKSGYTCACSAHTDLVTARTDPWQLPRFWVYDWSGDELVQRLQRWLR